MINRKLFIYLITIITLSSVSAKSQEALSLLIKMDNVIGAPKDKIATVKIITTDKGGKEKVREASLKQKGRYRKLYRYTKPEKQAGIATLALPNDMMYLYMPAFAEPVKINMLSKSQAVSGTDFSHEDMSGAPYSDRYTPTLKDSESEDLYLLELIPISKKSKYSKIMLHLNKTNKYPVKMEYFNKHGKFGKVATYKYVKLDGYWFAKEVLMVDVRKNHSTQILMTDVKFDQGLKNDEFLVKYLRE